MFIASANRVKARAPIEPGEEYGGLIDAGQSVILGPKGMSYKPVYYAGPASKTEEELLIATLDLSISDGLRTLGSNFTVNPMQGEPDFMPETWAKLWGTPATPPVNEELEAANRELAALRADYTEASQKTQTTTTAISILAAIFLLSTIGLGILAFRKKKS